MTPRSTIACIAAVLLTPAWPLAAHRSRRHPRLPTRRAGPQFRTTKSGAFSRQQLLEDARELAASSKTRILTVCRRRRRIAFHRRLHQALNAIPDEDDEGRVLQVDAPFVRRRDAHTNFLHSYSVDASRPRASRSG